jgi:hypothetical protein
VGKALEVADEEEELEDVLLPVAVLVKTLDLVAVTV